MARLLGQEDLCHANCVRTLEMVRQMKRATRRQLEAMTGFSWGGITNVVNRLINASYLCEHKEENESRASGRTPGILEINGEKHFVLGLDINNTGLNGCVMNLRGEEICAYSAPADFSSADALLGGIYGICEQAIAADREQQIMAIGVSMQGEVDGNQGVSVYLPQCPGWKDIPLRQILQDRFGKRVYLRHSPDCMLLAHMEEFGSDNTILLRLDESVGMAAAVNGGIVRGSGLWEIAHTIVMPGGEECACGAKGCLEAYVRRYAREARENPDGPDCLAQPLAFAVYNMIRLFRPQSIVLCGDLLKYRPGFCERFEKALWEIEGRHMQQELHILEGAKSAVQGAALVAIRHAIRHIEIHG